SLTRPENVACGRLALPFGHGKVFDAYRLTGEPVRPARNVASRKNARSAGLKILIHDDTAVNPQACCLCQSDLWPYPGGDDDEIGIELLPIVQCHTLRPYGLCRGTEMKADAMGFMQSSNKMSCIRPQYPFHRDRFWGNDIDLDISCAQRRRDLEADET